MKDVLRAALEELDVDYADIRSDEERKTQITLSNGRAEKMAVFSPRGGHVRAYADGAKAIASFSRIEGARDNSHQKRKQSPCVWCDKLLNGQRVEANDDAHKSLRT